MTIEVDQWRSIMGRFVTGVNVVTTVDKNGNPVGLTANAFSSVSLEPPLLLICADRKSETLKSLLGTKRFCVNILRRTGSSGTNVCIQNRRQVS